MARIILSSGQAHFVTPASQWTWYLGMVPGRVIVIGHRNWALYLGMVIGHGNWA